MSKGGGPASPVHASDAATSLAGSGVNRQIVNRLALIAILLIAAWLRFYALDASSLWNDEGTTWALLSRSFGQIARDAAADIHPPGYYWLLKAWAAAFGLDAWAIRSFSAVLGVLLVLVTYRIGLYLPQRSSLHVTALLAALLAALDPFQVYYGQEARMYMLLALQGAGLFWALFAFIERENAGRSIRWPALFYILTGAAGLWTHYSFPILLAAAGLAYGWHLLAARVRGAAGPALSRRLLRFVAGNAVIVLLFLPWLPIAITRVLNWPQGGDSATLAEGLRLTLQMFVSGPIRSAPDLAWPWLALAALLPLAGLWALRSHFAAPALGLWLLAPIALMFGLGLFSEAFLKFLLAAAPAWRLLSAAAPLCCGPRARLRHIFSGALALLATLSAALILPGYYADPAARDNYAGVARYLSVLDDADADLVILNAPGQQDVWSYYDPGLPVLRIPEQRPPDPAQTIAQLAAATQGRRQVYALFWATDESDPQRIVENWLDQQAFKGAESWQGNLRFVIYTLPAHLTCEELEPAPAFGPAIVLDQQCQPETPQQVSPGEAATVALHWHAVAQPPSSYKVSVQLLNERSQVVAQHDGLPAGGSRPSDAWQAGETVIDNHGLPIPAGTPPGEYRLIVALYDPASGIRLPVQETDHYALGTVNVVRPQQAIPVEVVPIPRRVHRQLGPVSLVGYAAHAKDFSHAPDTPLKPGDIAHFTLFWQAPYPLPPGWPDDLTFSLSLGGQTLNVPLAGGAYPTGLWQAGELVRAEFDIAFDGVDAAPILHVGADSYKLSALPTE